MRSSLRRGPAMLAAAALALVGLVGAAPGAGAAPAAADAQAAPRACRAGYVGLTFDDGPSATTPQLLAALAANRLRATFFDQGDHAEQYPDLVRAEKNSRHWVGNHSFTHPDLTQLAEPAVFQEIAATQWSLTDILGREPTLFRPPFGATNEQVRAVEQRLGLLEVLWTVDSQDWNGASAEQIAAAAGTLQPGGIILMHDWPPATIEAIPLIARDLAARGLCAGKIVHTPEEIPYGSTSFHAVAVRP